MLLQSDVQSGGDPIGWLLTRLPLFLEDFGVFKQGSEVLDAHDLVVGEEGRRWNLVLLNECGDAVLKSLLRNVICVLGRSERGFLLDKFLLALLVQLPLA